MSGGAKAQQKRGPGDAAQEQSVRQDSMRPQSCPQSCCTRDTRVRTPHVHIQRHVRLSAQAWKGKLRLRVVEVRTGIQHVMSGGSALCTR